MRTAVDADGQPVSQIRHHPLAREIITTSTVNEVVNGAGITYAFRLSEEMAAGPTDAIRAYEVSTAGWSSDSPSSACRTP